ncbi:uncharacterized protein LOC141536368 [Cotesia typhae]|uniref:uncharacterized protein LOC141536368 n=1 Tax=Cotesia typhae TaxID=2053667 RepID=UPI003D6975DF
MIFGSAYNLNVLGSNIIPNLMFNNKMLEYVEEFKYLGVLLNPTLSWTNQVAKTCSTSSRILYRLRQSAGAMNAAIKRQLVVSLVLPVFDYGAIALTNLNQNLEKKLTVALNNCARFVLRLRLGAHINEPRLELGWLSSKNRRLYLMGCIYYGVLMLNTNQLLSNNIRPNHNIARPRRGDRTDSLIAPIPRTAMYQNSFLIYGTAFWNSLPPQITTSSTLAEFKTQCFKYLQDLEREELGFRPNE